MSEFTNSIKEYLDAVVKNSNNKDIIEINTPLNTYLDTSLYEYKKDEYDKIMQHFTRTYNCDDYVIIIYSFRPGYTSNYNSKVTINTGNMYFKCTLCKHKQENFFTSTFS